MVKVFAPAKINLTLDITGKLPNGYHTVDMVMQTVDLSDIVTVKKSSNDGINLVCNRPFVPCNSSNTAYKAVEFFSQYCNIKCNVDITIEKNIPAQAGLAGGSTDGAAVLLALNKLYSTNLSVDELAKIGAKIGADVPFCLYGGTMLATGIGTTLEKIDYTFSLENYVILLCKPIINVSTPVAYQKSDSRPYSTTVHSAAVIEALKKTDEKAFLQELYNDFDSLLMLDEVQKIKAVMENNGSLKAVMSGSGPTVYGIYRNRQKAENTAEILKKSYTDVYITHTCKSGCYIVEN